MRKTVAAVNRVENYHIVIFTPAIESGKSASTDFSNKNITLLTSQRLFFLSSSFKKRWSDIKSEMILIIGRIFMSHCTNCCTTTRHRKQRETYEEEERKGGQRPLNTFKSPSTVLSSACWNIKLPLKKKIHKYTHYPAKPKPYVITGGLNKWRNEPTKAWAKGENRIKDRTLINFMLRKDMAFNMLHHAFYLWLAEIPWRVHKRTKHKK